MTDTRQQIIETALTLFNEKGYTSVSMRDISNTLGISIGNMTYHFPRKAQIVEAVIDHNKMRLFTSMPQEGASTLAEYYEIMKMLYNLQSEEKFYFSNMLEIARDIPQIYETQQTVRQVIFNYYKCSFANFKKNGIVVDTFDESIYDNLAFTLLYLACFWHLDYSMSKDKCFNHLEILEVSCKTLIPYLTKEGIKLFEDLDKKPA